MSKDNLKKIFEGGWWSKSGTTVCGSGSEREWAVRFTNKIELIVKKLKIKTVVDLGCGDMNIGGCVIPFVEKYYGFDLIDWGENWKVIRDNWDKVELQDNFNLVADNIPTVDLVICNNVFIHYPSEIVVSAMKNIANSKSKYFFAADYNGAQDNSARGKNLTKKDGMPSKKSYGAFDYEQLPFLEKIEILKEEKWISYNKMPSNAYVWRFI